MEEMKKCMRQAKNILSQEVGIMDTNGLIIAAMDQSLEGTIDSSARAVMISNDVFSSTSGKTYMKVPIGEQTKYILYIDSTEPTVRTYLELIAEWVKAAIKERGTDSEKDAFIKSVLLENELPGDIPLKARNFKIDCSGSRFVMVVRTSADDGSDALEVLQNLYSDSEDAHVVAMDERTIILVVSAQTDSDDDIIDVTSRSVLDCLNNEAVTAYIGVGAVVPHFQNISKSYRDAMQSLKIGNIFENGQYITRYDKLGLDRIIYQLPPTLCRMFIDEVFPNNAYETLDEDTLATINSFFANNLNGSETSRELFVHRNTLVYRLDKVQKNTGLNLRSFEDAVLFKIAAMVRVYLEYIEGNNDNMIR